MVEGKTYNVQVTDDWFEDSFWTGLEIVDGLVKQGQYTKAINACNAGLKSNNLPEHYRILLNYSKARVKYALKDFRGALIEISHFTNYSLTKSPSKITDPNYILTNEILQYIYDPFVLSVQINFMLKNDFEVIKMVQILLKLKTKKEIDQRLKPEQIERNGYLYFYRGFAKFHLKEKENACLDLSKAGDLGVPDAYKYIQQLCN